MGGPIVWLHLTIMTLKGQCQGHSDVVSLYGKGAKIGHMLLLNSNGKPYTTRKS